MQGLQLNHVSKRGSWKSTLNATIKFMLTEVNSNKIMRSHVWSVLIKITSKHIYPNQYYVIFLCKERIKDIKQYKQTEETL